ncbi:hypothetical protein ACH5RR_023133 [Cinchona calisaya]|uniref:Uncharacterized protein n=1 Tax=Cinchona calisaya TaxID=153742 RepID=A0ABD2Z9S1_9GENT
MVAFQYTVEGQPLPHAPFSSANVENPPTDHAPHSEVAANLAIESTELTSTVVSEPSMDAIQLENDVILILQSNNLDKTVVDDTHIRARGTGGSEREFCPHLPLTCVNTKTDMVGKRDVVTPDIMNSQQDLQRCMGTEGDSQVTPLD